MRYIPHIRRFQGLQEYTPLWQAMKDFCDQRHSNTPDEIWLLEHTPVYTQGRAGKPEHVLNPQNIPIVQTDRGGQVTYHGPGQLMIYTLLDINRLKINTHQLVHAQEQWIIDLLARYHIKATRQQGAPGLYVDNKKIASIGLRITKGCSYHGLALNINMDLGPFNGINPCGFSNLTMTQIVDFNPLIDAPRVCSDLTDVILASNIFKGAAHAHC
jgi:lipoyl(octanoyl) transferase